MKSFTNHPFRKIAYPFIMVATLAAFTTCTVVESVPERNTENNKTNQHRKMVKIYPDIIKKMIHVKCVKDDPVDFYVFDRSGAIVKYYKMTDRDHKKIYDLEKGNYTYNVFRNDEMYEAGKIIVK